MLGRGCRCAVSSSASSAKHLGYTNKGIIFYCIKACHPLLTSPVCTYSCIWLTPSPAIAFPPPFYGLNTYIASPIFRFGAAVVPHARFQGASLATFEQNYFEPRPMSIVPQQLTISSTMKRKGKSPPSAQEPAAKRKQRCCMLQPSAPPDQGYLFSA